MRQRMSCGKKPVCYHTPRTVQQVTRFDRMGQTPSTQPRILPRGLVKLIFLVKPQSVLLNFISKSYMKQILQDFFTCQSNLVEPPVSHTRVGPCTTAIPFDDLFQVAHINIEATAILRTQKQSALCLSSNSLDRHFS